MCKYQSKGINKSWGEFQCACNTLNITAAVNPTGLLCYYPVQPESEEDLLLQDHQFELMEWKMKLSLDFPSTAYITDLEGSGSG